MLTQTTLCGLRALLVLGQSPPGTVLSPAAIALRLGESPSYMAKVTNRLARAGLLRSHRGAGGGVSLGRNPASITLLHVVEACQGSLVPDYCGDTAWHRKTCGFHRAAAELHEAMVGVLSRWTLVRLLETPEGLGAFRDTCRCRKALPAAEASP